MIAIEVRPIPSLSAPQLPRGTNSIDPLSITSPYLIDLLSMMIHNTIDHLSICPAVKDCLRHYCRFAGSDVFVQSRAMSLDFGLSGYDSRIQFCSPFYTPAQFVAFEKAKIAEAQSGCSVCAGPKAFSIQVGKLRAIHAVHIHCLSSFHDNMRVVLPSSSIISAVHGFRQSKRLAQFRLTAVFDQTPRHSSYTQVCTCRSCTASTCLVFIYFGLCACCLSILPICGGSFQVFHKCTHS